LARYFCAKARPTPIGICNGRDERRGEERRGEERRGGESKMNWRPNVYTGNATNAQ
jgi:hypothetical protein